MKDPEYVAVHEHSKTSTPQGLTQVQFMWQIIGFLQLFLEGSYENAVIKQQTRRDFG